MTVSSLGGKMYGDGEYVVEFSGGGGVTGSPLVATVIGPHDERGTFRTASFGAYEKPSVKLAGTVIGSARRADNKAWLERDRRMAGV
jgi:hypothetical protein